MDLLGSRLLWRVNFLGLEVARLLRLRILGAGAREELWEELVDVVDAGDRPL